MAFSGKLGMLVKQSGQLQTGYMLNSIRCVSTKLFIGGLSYGTDDGALKDAFSGFGEVVEARIITDRDSGRSRGFGFVNYASEDSASSALSMDGQELHGRAIRVSYANERSSGGGGWNSGNRGFGNRGFGNNNEGSSY